LTKLGALGTWTKGANGSGTSKSGKVVGVKKRGRGNWKRTGHRPFGGGFLNERTGERPETLRSKRAERSRGEKC